MEKKWVTSLIVLMVGFAGIVFLVIGIGLSISQRNKKRVCTQPVTATVVDMESSYSTSVDGTQTLSWYPIYKYQANGKTFQKKANSGGTKNSFSIGQQLTLYLNQKNPEDFYCPLESENFLAKLFTGIGIFLLLAAVITRTVLHRILL